MEILRSAQNDTRETRHPESFETVTLSPSHSVILSNAKDLVLLRVNVAKSLRTSSVKASAVSSAERISGKMTHYQDSGQLDIRVDYRLPSAPKGTLSAKKEPMFILKPTQLKVFGKEAAETIEEVVKETRLVDKGITELKRFSRNAPSFDPERRRFLKHTAVLAALYASGQLLKGSAIAQEPVQFQGKTYSGWEAWLMSQDLIRGPGLILGRNGAPNDFKNHVENPFNQGFGAVDYSVSVGTPIVPTANSRSSGVYIGSDGNKILVLLHPQGHNSQYAHINDFSKFVYEGKYTKIRNTEFWYKSINKLKIMAFSGNSGIGPEGRTPQPQVHFEIRLHKFENKELFERLSLDPFEFGINAEKSLEDYMGRRVARPLYWDGKTAITITAKNKKTRLQESLDTIEKRVKQSNLDQATVKEILDRQNKPEELRDYLGMRVLQKKQAAAGKQQYEFMPGSLMYGLMLEFYGRTSKEGFIAMLPFMFPPLKPVYQKANPGVQF